MWDLIVSVPDHCLSFYFVATPMETVFFHFYFSCMILAGTRKN